ncbi:MAG: hypothetical protein JWO45_1579 [Spartobacteria bacterium]|nr:hypothetical protein [Spartobacteria bacterium]
MPRREGLSTLWKKLIGGVPRAHYGSYNERGPVGLRPGISSPGKTNNEETKINL